MNYNFRRQKFKVMGYLGTQMKMFDLLLARTRKSQWIRSLDKKTN